MTEIGAAETLIKKWWQDKTKIILLLLIILLIGIIVFILRKPAPALVDNTVFKNEIANHFKKAVDNYYCLQQKNDELKSKADSLERVKGIVQVVYSNKIKYIYLNKYSLTQLDSVVRANW